MLASGKCGIAHTAKIIHAPTAIAIAATFLRRKSKDFFGIIRIDNK